MNLALPILLIAFLPGLQAHAESAKRMTGTRRLPAMPEKTFTIVIIPDTQSYKGKGCKATPDSADPVTNENLEAQVNWIRDHRDDQSIVFVSHVGDIVDKNNAEQWAVARRHLDMLRGVVPFSLTVGNHDMTSKGDATLFQVHFPASSFTAHPWYLGSYTHTRADQNVSASNVNSAQLFSAGGIDFIHLSLECNAPDDVLAWANETLSKHSGRRALLTTHMDLGIRDKPKTNEGYIHDPKGRMRWIKIHGERGNTGEQMWDKLYRKHANLDFIFCGDQSRVTALRVTQDADDGHPVNAMLSDYLSQPVLRLLRFVPAEDRVHAVTYDVVQKVLVDDTPYVHELEQHQFELEYRMSSKSAAGQSR
jgi:hypothetical protein